MSTLDLVKDFHKCFQCPIHDHPMLLDQGLNAFRVRLIREEAQELDDALVSGHEEEVLDALCDLQYVLDGAFLALGFHHYKDKAFKAVHISNMAKLGPDGKPIIRADGKIMKPEGWQPPNLALVIRSHDY